MHRGHGFSPYFLVFGREADLPSIVSREPLEVEAIASLSDDQLIELAE